MNTLFFLGILLYTYNFSPLNSQGASGYLQFEEPAGSGGLESLYALSITSTPSSSFDLRGNPLPQIPATTFSLTDVSLFQGTFNWDENRVSGNWQLNFNFFQQLHLSVEVDSAEIQSFYPLEYDFNEHSAMGSWLYAGTKSVPERGGTLLYLSLGLVFLGAANLTARKI